MIMKCVFSVIFNPLVTLSIVMHKEQDMFVKHYAPLPHPLLQQSLKIKLHRALNLTLFEMALLI